MANRILYIVLLFLFLLNPIILFSQIRSVNSNIPKGYIGLGIDFGLTSFYGDIDEGSAPGGLLKNNYATRIHASKNFIGLISIEGQITFGKTSGQKKRSSSTSSTYSYFNASFIEYTLNAGTNLIALFSNNINRKLSIYANVGIGLIDIKTKLYDGYTNTVIKYYGYNGKKSTTEMVIPVGGKVIYHIDEYSSVSLQTTFSRVDTDKLDAVEGNNNRDYYNYTSLGYIYKIHLDQKRGNPSRKSKGGGYKGVRRNYGY